MGVFAKKLIFRRSIKKKYHKNEKITKQEKSYCIIYNAFKVSLE